MACSAGRFLVDYLRASPDPFLQNAGFTAPDSEFGLHGEREEKITETCTNVEFEIVFYLRKCVVVGCVS